MPTKLGKGKDKKPKTSDVYVGMLFISLVAFIGGAALLYLDYSQYTANNPPPIKATQGGPAGSGSGARP